MIKRLTLITVSLVLSLLFSNMHYRTEPMLIPTMAVPVTNRVIVLDAGHGTPDEGNYLLTLINNN